jgi:hypothetical protein
MVNLWRACSQDTRSVRRFLSELWTRVDEGRAAMLIFLNRAPVAQLDQSVWLRTRRSGVRVSPGAPSFLSFTLKSLRRYPSFNSELMDEKTALHTAARRYCQERFSYWIRVYEELQHKENWQVQRLFEPGWDYSDEAYRTFPRYRIAKNTQVEIERLTVDSSASLSEMRMRLICASEKAETQLQTELNKTMARNALREEAEDYRVYLEVLTPVDLAHVEALPFRRVLNREESKQLWDELGKTWGIDGSCWFPLKEGPIPSHVLSFHTDYFQEISGARLLREAVQTRGISRVFQLHEFGDPEYEIELAIFEPSYRDGGEQYSTSTQTDWVVYASHESSITICGDWLIQIFRELRPGCTERTYKGPYSTTDLRGTWDTD